MEVLLLLTTGAMCILCFLVGAKVGQTVSKGEEVKVPELNPITAIQERNARKQVEKAQNRLDTILQNIDSYDGTGIGQKEVPEA